jgi:D-alanine--poly(phosphoribitol) ligase subunit 2
MSNVRDLVERAVVELNKDLRAPARVPIEQGEDAALFGDRGVLDSLQLVRLVLELEDAVDSRFGITVTLADERAVSQTVSPFRTIGTLTDYIQGLLNEAEAGR